MSNDTANTPIISWKLMFLPLFEGYPKVLSTGAFKNTSPGHGRVTRIKSFYQDFQLLTLILLPKFNSLISIY